MSDFDLFLEPINYSCKYLNINENKELLNDIDLVCHQSDSPYFTIAFLAPFNFGKSTLINALLGSEVLPAKAVRTTGLAVEIKYGEDIETFITLSSGELIRRNGSDILKEFVTLNRQGTRRYDVVSAEVIAPSKLLKNQIKLVDLPGTNDSDEQNELVKDEIFKSDLIVQVLNANQVFTLDEQDKNRDWLRGRGVSETIFVINRMNQIENRFDRREVFNNALGIVDLINANSRKWIKAVYRVDALPALQAAQEKKILKILKSGIIELKASLFTLAHFQKQEKEFSRLLRLSILASKVKDILINKIETLVDELEISENQRKKMTEEAKRRESFCLDELHDRIRLHRSLLSPDTLFKTYESELAGSLEKKDFSAWENSRLKPKMATYSQLIEHSVDRTFKELGKKNSEKIIIKFPSPPNLELPSRKDRTFWGSVSDIFNSGKNKRMLDKMHEKDKWEACKISARSYLSQLSQNALMSLDIYERKVKPNITFEAPPESIETIEKRKTVAELKSLIARLEKIKYCIKKYENPVKFKLLDRLKFLMVFTRNWVLFAIDLI